MLPALNPRRPGQTHRAVRLPSKHAPTAVARANGRGNCRPHCRATQVGCRNRHRPRAEALIDRPLNTQKAKGRNIWRYLAVRPDESLTCETMRKSTALFSAFEKLFCPAAID